MKNNATATWKGTGIDGKGSITSKSNTLKQVPYSFKARTESRTPGTNPEELIASAHAACFAMKLAFVLETEGYVATELKADCEVSFEAGVISGAHLFVKAIIPGIDKGTFEELVNNSGRNCPVSKLLNTDVTIGCELM